MRQISDERKTAYYIGSGLMGIGLILFLSTFVTFISHFGDFSNFVGDAKSDFGRAFFGMILMMLGGAIRGIGAQGLAGSGTVLDPQRAREDLEPFSRQAGGMLGDALDEAGIDLSKKRDEPQIVQVVKLKCQGCAALNDEHAKFCSQCGAPF